MIFEVDNEQVVGNNIYKGKFTTLAGCDDIIISHDVRRIRGNGGSGVEANRLRLKQAASHGASAVICTVNCDNVKQLAILKKNGWQCLKIFRSKFTRNKISLMFKSTSGV